MCEEATGNTQDATESFKLDNQQKSTFKLNHIPITCAMWNVTAMICKTEQIMEHLMDRNPSIIFLSETWLKSDKK